MLSFQVLSYFALFSFDWLDSRLPKPRTLDSTRSGVPSLIQEIGTPQKCEGLQRVAIQKEKRRVRMYAAGKNFKERLNIPFWRDQAFRHKRQVRKLSLG